MWTFSNTMCMSRHYYKSFRLESKAEGKKSSWWLTRRGKNFLRSRYADKCRRLHNGKGPFLFLSLDVLLANEGNGTEKRMEESFFIVTCLHGNATCFVILRTRFVWISSDSTLSVAPIFHLMDDVKVMSSTGAKWYTCLQETARGFGHSRQNNRRILS